VSEVFVTQRNKKKNCNKAGYFFYDLVLTCNKSITNVKNQRMKKLLVIMALSVFAVSCGSSESTETKAEDTPVVAPVDTQATIAPDTTTVTVDTTKAATDTTKKN
jgi:hypothetical protein